MGFCDLATFNQAMLAKQGWRVIQSPSSLMSRILKFQYFTSSHFLEASLGSSPSCIWTSIIRGRETLNLGLRWRIGSGEKENFFRSLAPSAWLL